jgi:hypothetical protein
VEAVAGFVVGAVIGFIVNEVMGRGLGAVLRRRAIRNPLMVHIEEDTSMIWAGSPPWVGAAYLLPLDADLVDPPPSNCPDWFQWARARGGIDQDLTQLRLTLTARKDLVVVVDGLRVRVHARRPAPAWRSVVCGTGGADLTPRRAEVRLSDFDPPVVYWLDDEGESVDSMQFSLAADDVEMLHIWAYSSEDECVEWTAELLAIVDGQRKVIPFGSATKPFVTSGSSGASSSHMRVSGGGEWSPPI